MAMSLKAIAIFCLAIVPISHCYDNIDAFMTEDQIQRFFHTDTDTVPLHEVVEINFPERNKRDLLVTVGIRITIRAFGDDIPLWLRPTEKVLFGAQTPIYWARRALGKPGNVTFIREFDMLEGIGILLEDPEHLASLIIGKEDSENVTLTGHISKRGLAIKPFPHGYANEYLRKRRSMDNFNSSNSKFHVIYKTNKNFGQDDSIDSIDQSIFHERTARSTDQIPSVLYPELLIVVDHSTYMVEMSDLNGFMEYLVAYWNGVDLKYRTLENPKVRFHISGIVIAMDPRALPYIWYNMASRTSVNSAQSANDSRSFFYAIKDTFPLESYDIAVTMTRLRMLGGNRNDQIMGFAYRGSACTTDDVNKIRWAVAFCRDDGVFGGVHSIAHELGHSFGLGHDNATDNCLLSDGYIMGYTPVYTKNSSVFSNCSIQEFQTQLNDGNLKCLYNVPQSFGKNMPKLMPGKFKNLEAQCEARRLGLPCNVTSVNVCVNYHCRDTQGNCKNTGYAALDGTACGNGSDVPPRFCLKNECVYFPQAGVNGSSILPYAPST